MGIETSDEGRISALISGRRVARSYYKAGSNVTLRDLLPGEDGVAIDSLGGGVSGTINILTNTKGTLGPERIATGTYRRWAVGTLTIREQMRSGSIPAARIKTGTISVPRIPTLPSVAGTLDIVAKTLGTLPASRSAGATPTGTIDIVTNTKGSLPINTRARGTLPARLHQLLPNIPGSISVITKTFGTVPASRSTGGTLSDTRNAGSLTRGTIGVPRLQLLPSIPGTISLLSKTSGSLPINTRATGTLAAQRHQLLPNIPGTLSIVTKTLGSLPINTRATGTLPAREHQLLPNIPGSISILTKTSGTLGPTRVATGTYARWAVGTLNVREQMRSGTVPASRVSTGTFGEARIPSISLITRTYGSLPINTRATGTLAAQRHQLLPNIPGSLSIVTKTLGSLPINTRATGTLPAREHQLLQNIPGTIGILVKTSGTLGPTRIATGTYSRWAVGTLNVREQVRSGTVPAARVSTGTLGEVRIPSISIVTRTYGSLPVNARATGTLPAREHQQLPNIPGSISIISKTYGTLPLDRGGASVRVIFAENDQFTLTGTLGEQTLFTYTIPGGLLGTANGLHMLHSSDHVVGGPETIKMRLYFGGTPIFNKNSSDTEAIGWELTMFNRGVGSKQAWYGKLDLVGGVANDLLFETTAIDTTVNQILKLTVKNNNNASNSTNNRFNTVELIRV